MSPELSSTDGVWKVPATRYRIKFTAELEASAVHDDFAEARAAMHVGGKSDVEIEEAIQDLIEERGNE